MQQQRPDPILPPTQVFRSRAAVEAKLASMDLAATELIGVADFAEAQARESTPNDPVSFSGTTRWAKMTRGLRERLGPRGWQAVNPNNLSLTVNSEGTIAIVVVSGNAATGNATRRFVPSAQLSFAVISDEFPEEDVTPTLQLWFLLHDWDAATDTLSIELSRPFAIGDDNRIAGWAERIIIGPIDGWSQQAPALPSGSDDSGDDALDIPVEKRA